MITDFIGKSQKKKIGKSTMSLLTSPDSTTNIKNETWAEVPISIDPKILSLGGPSAAYGGFSPSPPSMPFSLYLSYLFFSLSPSLFGPRMALGHTEPCCRPTRAPALVRMDSDN